MHARDASIRGPPPGAHSVESGLSLARVHAYASALAHVSPPTARACTPLAFFAGPASPKIPAKSLLPDHTQASYIIVATTNTNDKAGNKAYISARNTYSAPLPSMATPFLVARTLCSKAGTMEPAPAAAYALFDLTDSASASFHLQFLRGTKIPTVEAFLQTGSVQSQLGAAERNVLDASFDLPPSAESKGSAIIEDECGRESDALSDAGTYHLCERSEGSEEDVEAIAELFDADAVRKKMAVLAGMVGMGVSDDEPGKVLGEVVKVLRELQRKAELVGWRSSRVAERQG
ncbi:hypothetical protein Cni_G23352 [Canna indica]|uniref:Uncharacterized protein n=1 Tax=Canna indica TaxID=4628 RepID=A0AAQ3KW08_9LILI|nr:hypothetical protein Cni_G23352 [Canna indica]